jgi:hypothetical protein
VLQGALGGADGGAAQDIAVGDAGRDEGEVPYLRQRRKWGMSVRYCWERRKNAAIKEEM